MPKYIGRLANVWFGVESTRGTAVNATTFTPKTDFSFYERAETIQDESSIWVIADSLSTEVIRKWAEWELTTNASANSVWALFYSLLGSVTSAQATTWAYTHNYTLANSNTHPTLTTCISDPTQGAMRYPLTMIQSMTLNAEEGGYATLTVSLKAKPGEETTHTVSYDIEKAFLSKYSVFKTASNLAGLDWASSVCLKSFELTIEKNLEDDFCLGSHTPVDFLNKQTAITGSFTLQFTDETFKDFQLNGTQRAVRFELINTDVTIWVSNNPTLRIDLPLAGLTEWSLAQGNDEIVMQTLTFKANYSQVDSSMINARVINTTEAYTS